MGPLKLSMRVGRGGDGQPPADATLPAFVLLSRCRGPQMLLSRSGDGQVYCWRLNDARSQLVSEEKLLTRGGLIAASASGFWIAVVNMETDAGEGQVDIWTYESTGGEFQQTPKMVLSL